MSHRVLSLQLHPVVEVARGPGVGLLGHVLGLREAGPDDGLDSLLRARQLGFFLALSFA